MTDIKELQELMAKATPGPWRSTWSDPPVPDADPYDDVPIIVSTAPNADELPLRGSVVCQLEYGGQYTAGCTEPNAAFIVATRNALPELLDRLERSERIAMDTREQCAKELEDRAAFWRKKRLERGARHDLDGTEEAENNENGLQLAADVIRRGRIA